MILNTTDYKQKITSLLEEPAYRRLTKDPMDSIERKTIQLLKNSTLTEDTRKQLRPASSRPPRLYRLPKIHKEGVPLRRIVNNIGAPTYQLAKHLNGTSKTSHRKLDTPSEKFLPLHQDSGIGTSETRRSNGQF